LRPKGFEIPQDQLLDMRPFIYLYNIFAYNGCSITNVGQGSKISSYRLMNIRRLLPISHGVITVLVKIDEMWKAQKYTNPLWVQSKDSHHANCLTTSGGFGKYFSLNGCDMVMFADEGHITKRNPHLRKRPFQVDVFPPYRRWFFADKSQYIL
jgi:hypothetical protein